MNVPDDDHSPHRPVMLDEVIDFIKPGKGDIIVDATIGAGGHSCEILKKIQPDGLLIGIDKDAEILKIADKFLSKIGDNYKLYQADFADLGCVLEKLKLVRSMVFCLTSEFLRCNWILWSVDLVLTKKGL